MSGIYVHIPFCKQACHYCDFHFSTNRQDQQLMVDGIVKEIEIQRNYITDTVNTIYFGGGTPSILPNEALERILKTIYANFQVGNPLEVTLEANPDDLSPGKLEALKRAGVNRLSIGIQSFDDGVLKFFNRPHSAAEAVACMNEARLAGFDNISIDLIYAVPNQDDVQWKKNILQALDLEPEHISAYALTIEPKTVFGIWEKRGKLKSANDDLAAGQLEQLVDLLGSAGFEQYEVSNFCRPGYHSRHNSSYWKQEHYLGVGPSAHSYNGISRQFNISNNPQYVKALQTGDIPFQLEVLSNEDKVNEYLLTSLRTSWGSNLNFLKTELGIDLLKVHSDYINFLVEKKHATIDAGHLKLTRSGKLLADKISSDLFIDKTP